MHGVLALPAVLLALASPAFHASSAPVPRAVQTQLKAEGFWRSGCPVALSGLRQLTVTHWGFDGRRHTGKLIVNAAVAGRVGRVFGSLYALRFPIRHMQLEDFYGPKRGRPKDGDVTASFDCRQAVPSPCTGGSGTGTWSMHAFGLAVDVNPLENPYVGCGQSRDPTARRYFDRSRHRRGMVTRPAIGAFAAVGWGWGGSWAGSTKDYMHFSSNGH